MMRSDASIPRNRARNERSVHSPQQQGHGGSTSSGQTPPRSSSRPAKNDGTAHRANLKSCEPGGVSALCEEPAASAPSGARAHSNFVSVRKSWCASHPQVFLPQVRARPVSPAAPTPPSRTAAAAATRWQKRRRESTSRWCAAAGTVFAVTHTGGGGRQGADPMFARE